MRIQETEKPRGEISLPNISGIPGIIVKDPAIAEMALDAALGVFVEIYSINGIDTQNEIASLTEQVSIIKDNLLIAQEGSLSQEIKRKVRKGAIDFLRSASDFHAENQKRKANGDGKNGKVIFDSSL